MRFEISSCRRSVFTSFWLAGLTTSDFKNEIFVYLFVVVVVLLLLFSTLFSKKGLIFAFARKWLEAYFWQDSGLLKRGLLHRSGSRCLASRNGILF